MRRHHHRWMSCRDAGPESLIFGLSVVLFLLAIGIIAYLAGGR